MAVIRIPESATALLPYCSAHRNKRDDSFFKTYAHLMIFAAEIGYRNDEFDNEVDFCKKEPYPIQIEVFQSLGLYDHIVIIALAHTKSYAVVNDADQLAKIAEGYASAGFREMLRRFERCSGHNFLDEWVQEVVTL